MKAAGRLVHFSGVSTPISQVSAPPSWRLWNQDGTPGQHVTHMFTADRDGGSIWPLNLEDMSSHYT